jgi:hypothetical protein
MAVHALPMKGLTKLETGGGKMTLRTSDTRRPLDQLTLIQHILPLIIPVVAVFTRETRFDMAHVRQRHRGSLFGSKGRLVIELDLIRLSLKQRGGEGEEQNHHDP